MGADKLYLTVEPAPGTEAEDLAAALPTEEFFRWLGVEDGLVVGCRHSRDHEIAARMLRSELERIRRAAMVEIADTAMVGTGYLYERVGDELVLVDRAHGGESYGRDVASYFTWRFDVDAIA